MTEPLPLALPGATPVRVMTVAGSDSGGGAGIQADMRTFALLGVHGCVSVTAVTVQNSTGVSGFHEIPPSVVADQMSTVVDDIGVSAVKTGMLASAAIIEAVTARATELGIGGGAGRSGTGSGGTVGGGGSIPLVVDPVCASMHGDPLLVPDALGALRDTLFPIATVVTPNLDEVRLLTGIDVVDETTQRSAAMALRDLGAQWALVKGGHLRGSELSPDLLYDGREFITFPALRIDTPHDHGAGDTLAAAMTAALGHGRSVPDAVAFAKDWVTRGLAASYPLGAGHGPVNPLWRLNEC